MTAQFLRKHLPLRLTKAPVEGSEDRIIEGYASTFEPPDRHDSYGDIILPGAFAESIRMHERAVAGDDEDAYRVKLFLRHSIGIGAIEEMREDSKGLWFRARISETRDGDDALTLARDLVLDSVSIGFNYEPQDCRDLDVMTPWGYPVRAFNRIRLKENSLVEIPANEYARVTEVREARKSAYLARTGRRPSPSSARKSSPLRGRRPGFKSEASVRKGLNLGVLISKLIWKLADDMDMSIDQAVDAAADSAGLDRETIVEIMQGADMCPTMPTLEALAAALDDPLAALVAAAQADGCEYDVEGSELEAPETARKAAQFGSLLSSMLADLATDDTPLSEVVADLADEMTMSVDDLQLVLDGEAGCPTIDMIQSVAFLLDAEMEPLISAAEADGCVYDLVTEDTPAGEDGMDGEGATLDDVLTAISDLRDMLVAD